MMGVLALWHWLILLAIIGFFVWIYARIVRKAGFSGWWSLIIFVPLVNIAMIWVFAFVDWPAAAGKEKVAGVFD